MSLSANGFCEYDSIMRPKVLNDSWWYVSLKKSHISTWKQQFEDSLKVGFRFQRGTEVHGVSMVLCRRTRSWTFQVQRFNALHKHVRLFNGVGTWLTMVLGPLMDKISMYGDWGEGPTWGAYGIPGNDFARVCFKYDRYSIRAVPGSFSRAPIKYSAMDLPAADQYIWYLQVVEWRHM